MAVDRAGAAPVGGEPDGRAVRRPGRMRRPLVEVGRQIATLARFEVDEPQRRVADALRDVLLVTHAGHPAAIGRAGRTLVPGVVRRQLSPRAGGAIDGHDAEVRAADLIGHDRSRHDRGAIGRDVEYLLDERRRGEWRQVDRVGDALLSDRQWGGEEMPLARTVVRVPVTDREGVEQQRLDARLLARLVALPVGCRIGGARKDRGRVNHHVGVAGGNDRVHAARWRRQQPSFAAVGRQQPQPADLLVVAPSSGVRSGSGREEVNRIEPSRANVAALSPGAERVSRRGRSSPVGSSSHSELCIFLPSGAGRPTATMRRRPSGEARRPPRRGRRR